MGINPDDKWYLWPAYFSAVFWGGGALLLLVLGVISVVGALLPGALSTALIYPFMAVAFGWLLVSAGLNLLALVSYYNDAKKLKARGESWTPSGVGWALTHVILSPITPPLYLRRRGNEVGNDYSGTYLERLPLFGD